MKRDIITHCTMALAVVFFSAVIPLVQAGTIILSGDVTPVFRIHNILGPDNHIFFENVLGNGTQVAILDSEYSSASIRANSFYNDLSGVSSLLLNGTITATDLENVDLFLLPVPDRPFISSEIEVIDQFIQSDGIIFLMGESSEISFGLECNKNINDLLLALNIEMALDNNSFDPGDAFTSGGTHPLTAGIISYGYGGATSITGGTPLFCTYDGSPFVAIVPEPATLLLVGIGAVMMRKVRSQ